MKRLPERIMGYAEAKPEATPIQTGFPARIRADPPDILLPNYVMLELLMTRSRETDKAVRRHAPGAERAQGTPRAPNQALCTGCVRSTVEWSEHH